MLPPIPKAWELVLSQEVEKPYYRNLEQFLKHEREKHHVYPPEPEVFSALELTPYEEVQVVLLGQDPYANPGHAHGLSFSVRPGVKPPPSLQNIFKELKSDIDFHIPNNGYLVPWAQQGVLLLNTVLTVQAYKPGSHKNQGWEQFTNTIIQAINTKQEPVIFLLWGRFAQQKIPLIDTSRHVILQAAHPSPLSANQGFFGSRPFSQTNAALQRAGKPAIDWQIPDLTHG